MHSPGISIVAVVAEAALGSWLREARRSGEGSAVTAHLVGVQGLDSGLGIEH